MNSQDYKDQVLAAVPIEAYIGRTVALKRAGKRLVGLCPFHTEKSPSFSVTPEKGFFYCFGCGKGGDLLRFVMDHEGMPFPEALDTLARFAGIEKPAHLKHGGPKNDRRDKLSELNERVLRAFQTYLASPDGRRNREYLAERGLTPATIDTFALGASPDSFEWLRNKFQGDEKELVELGLLKQGRDDRPPYDFFRDRVIFPIRDGGGRAVAFGGRAMPQEQADPDRKAAKYINSPESALFHKSRVLYGLYHGMSEIRSKGECILVEGYMDVIGLYQAGFQNACAPLGTALTSDHLKLISRYTSKLLCIFDGDGAGRRAALKFARLSLEQGGLAAHVLLLPGGLDPFDLSMKTPGPQIAELLDQGRIPAEKFYLLETMFPDRFADFAADRRWEDPREFARYAREFYLGELQAAMPHGTEKRPGLDRLFASVGEIGRESDRVFLLEEAGRMLGLNPVEVLREWEQAGRPGVRRDPGSSRPAPVNAGPAPEFAAAPESRRVAAGPRSEQRRPDPLQRRIASCERAMVLELLFAPAVFGEYQQDVAGLEFEDAQAEFLWRYLETRYLTGNLWRPDDFGRFELPEETLQGFTEAVLRREEAGSGSDGGGNRDFHLERSVLRDLLVEHRILKLKKRIAENERRYTVADSIDQSYLIEENGNLLKELKKLESMRRNSGQPAR